MDTKDIFKKRQCSCCGFFTISGIGEICPVCFWEEDFFQEKHIDNSGGPNTISLKEAKENFESFGAMEARFKDNVRAPLYDEIKGD